LDENQTAETELINFHDRFLKGEIGPAGWINATDIQKPRQMD